jgi:hypothetical protein
MTETFDASEIKTILENGNPKIQQMFDEISLRGRHLNAIKEDVKAFDNVPKSLRDDEIYSCAINNGLKLKLVPKKKRTKSHCLISIEINENNMKYVPDHLSPDDHFEIYTYGIKKYGAVLHLVPKKYRTTDLCIYAIEQNIVNLHSVPKNAKDERFYIKLVKLKPDQIMKVPDRLMSHRIYEESMNTTVIKKLREDHHNISLQLLEMNEKLDKLLYEK